MKLILTQEVANLGGPGDIVEVKDGYGRNFLVPRGYAITWTKGAEKQITHIKRAQDVRQVRDLSHAADIKAQLESLTITITAKAGTSGQLFGRITERDIAEAIRRAGGPAVDKRRIAVASPVKSLGRHSASVGIHADVAAAVEFEVAPA